MDYYGFTNLQNWKIHLTIPQLWLLTNTRNKPSDILFWVIFSYFQKAQNPLRLLRAKYRRPEKHVLLLPCVSFMYPQTYHLWSFCSFNPKKAAGAGGWGSIWSSLCGFSKTVMIFIHCLNFLTFTCYKKTDISTFSLSAYFKQIV